ncbi:hypothetical protein I79_019106 [Cricetulus griseus]|uniref:Uncharacterized protein n=1 Tax=Cricetulus griseus TaxID=10029 RepID=G3I6I2_CRIGR|nr:hypothetical protein I79_019106 [Cricetulus griseus]
MDNNGRKDTRQCWIRASKEPRKVIQPLDNDSKIKSVPSRKAGDARDSARTRCPGAGSTLKPQSCELDSTTRSGH